MTDQPNRPNPEPEATPPEPGKAERTPGRDREVLNHPEIDEKREQMKDAPPLGSGADPAAPTAMVPCSDDIDFHAPPPKKATTPPQKKNPVPPPPKPKSEPEPEMESESELESEPELEPGPDLETEYELTAFELPSRRIVGLSLCEHEISVARLEQDKQQIRIARAGSMALENTTNEDMVSTIRSLWKTHQLGSRTVWANIETRLMIQKYFSFQGEPEELKEVLLPEAEELLQIPANEIACDFHINDVPGPGNELCGMMYALPRWEMNRALSILKQAGLYVCGLSVVPCDLARIYKGFFPEPFGDRPRGIMHLTRETADFVFLFGDHSIYTRTVVSRTGGWDNNLPYLVKCINDATLYFGHWVCEDPIERLDLCGRIPEATDLTGFLLRETGLPIFYWLPFQPDADIYPANKPALDPRDASQLISCIAAGIRGD